MTTQGNASLAAEARARRQERAARRERIDGRMTSVDAPVHGEHGTYKNWVCRCTPCTLAHTAAEKEARRGRWDRTKRNGNIAPGDRAHGRPCTYWNWGCQCGPCRGASARARSGAGRTAPTAPLTDTA